MGLSNIDIIAGITGLEIILCGYICGINLIARNSKNAPSKETKTPVILFGIVFIGLYHSWFSVASGFLLLSLGGSSLGQIPSLLGYAWGPALAVPILAYNSAGLIKGGRLKIPITIVVALLSIIFFALVYSDPMANTFYNPSPEGGLPDSGFQGLAMAVLGLMLIFIMLFVGPVYLFTSSKTVDVGEKWKKISIGMGAILFSISATIDAGVADITLAALAIVRACIFTSIFLMFQGASLPDVYKKTPGAPPSDTTQQKVIKKGSIQGRIGKSMAGCVLVPTAILTTICASQLIPFSSAIGSTATTNMVIVFILIAIAIIVAIIFITLRAAQRIIRPINELTRSIENMAKGDLSKEIPLDAKQRGDEIGVLAQSFQNLLTTIRLGNKSYYQGDMSLAFTNYNSALELFQTTNNLRGQGTCLNNLGNIYRNWGNFDKALECYENAIKIGEQQDDLGGLTSRYNNRGLLYLSKERWGEAMRDLEAALTIDEKIGDDTGKAIRKRNIAVLHILTKKLDVAKKYLDEAFRIDNDLKNKGGMAEDQFQLGRLALLTNDLDSAEEQLKSSIKLAEKLGNYPLMKNILEEMIRLYESRGDTSLHHKVQLELAKVEENLVAEKDVIFVIDQSGSMGEQEKIIAARNGALEIFNEVISDKDRIAIIGFHSVVTSILPLIVKKDNPHIKEILVSLMETRYQTCFYDAVAYAIDTIKNSPKERHKWIVAITDGQDNASKDYNSHKLAKYIKNFGQSLNLILIGVGPELRRVYQEMEEIVSATPQGKYIKIYSAENVRKQIEEAFLRVKEIMASSEIEGFTPEEK